MQKPKKKINKLINFFVKFHADKVVGTASIT